MMDAISGVGGVVALLAFGFVVVQLVDKLSN
jgi:hypothetical protein